MARGNTGRPTGRPERKFDDKKGPKQGGPRYAQKGAGKAAGEAKGPYKGGATAKGPFKGEGDTKGFRKDDRKAPRNRFIDNDLQDDDRDDENINLIEGRNPVLEALKSGREIDKLFVQKGAGEGSIRQILAMAREKNILIKEVDKAKLDGLSTTKNHQGVIASAALYKYYEVEDILNMAKEKNEEPFIIILDEITDNNNLGSILRTADAAGVHGVIIPKRRSVALTPVVAKTSAGAVEYVPVAKVTNLNQTMKQLKDAGLWIVGAEMSGDTYYQKDLTGPIALVIGSEGEGIGRLIKENCDFLVKIPMSGRISSLNAGVSAGIIAFDVVRQRQLKSLKGGIH